MRMTLAIIATTMMLTAAPRLTDEQQLQHDAIEHSLYVRWHWAEDRTADQWRPNPKLVSALQQAHECYVKFHLYQVKTCASQFEIMEQLLR